MKVVAYQGDRLLIETSVDESGMAYGYVADSAYTPLTAEKALITYLARGYWTPMPEGQVVKSLAPYLEVKTRHVRNAAYWGAPVGTPLPLARRNPLPDDIGDVTAPTTMSTVSATLGDPVPAGAADDDWIFTDLPDTHSEVEDFLARAAEQFVPALPEPGTYRFENIPTNTGGTGTVEFVFYARGGGEMRVTTPEKSWVTYYPSDQYAPPTTEDDLIEQWDEYSNLDPVVTKRVETPRRLLDTPIPGVHVSVSGDDPGVSGWIHIGDEEAATDRLDQIQTAVDMIGAMGYDRAKVRELIDHHVLHGKPLNPKFYDVEILVEPMNTPDTLVSDEFANLVTGERRRWAPVDEARERGWDGNPLDISQSLDGDYVKVDMTQAEWITAVERRVISDIERARPWEYTLTEMALRQREIWEQIQANGYRVDPLYYLNSGEATSEPSIVAAAGDAQWTERS